MIRILIADPDPATRKALTLLLRRKMGTDGIVEVGDVETLIHTLADVSPDLLLLDWRLYGSPAPDTCRLLQKAYPQLKIVLLSVDATDTQLALKQKVKSLAGCRIWICDENTNHMDLACSV